jgi:predicted NACHT family NTPase
MIQAMTMRKHAGRCSSLQASSEGIEKAKKALKQYSLTQKHLAQNDLNINLYTVNKFFKGKPVEREYFYQICQKLNLEWDKIVSNVTNKSAPKLEAQDEGSEIDAFVQEVRQKIRPDIVIRCGTMQVLDMTHPIGLNDIYISVNILSTITKSRRLEIADLLQGNDPTDFNRFGLGRITEERLPGCQVVDQHSKLMVLGKPGVGKTTFLKYLAIQCSLDDSQSDKVPIFITLKDYADAETQPRLLKYVTQLLGVHGVADSQTVDLLKHGRAMILLDGLDEVREEHSYRVLQQIRDFSDQFHRNQFVITCRIAGREYSFEEFVEVEVADFDAQQINSFVTKWFAPTDPANGDRFIQKLKENQPIQELANNPLLLTLLCLVFSESADFPSNQAQLYREGLNLLLKKWDANQNIERSQVYKELSIQHKQDLLSQIALKTFEQGNYFFRQKEIEQQIADYIYNIPGTNNEFETLQLNSEAVLKSIEAQHGLLVERARSIYSFSHLTFQEYFAARQIVGISNPQGLEMALKQLVSRITEKRWHEVFLLSVVMVRKADYLLQLMKQQIEQLVAQDQRLQAFLRWANQKSVTVTTSCKPLAVRTYYLAIARTIVLVSDTDINQALTLAGNTVEIAFALDPTFALDQSAIELSLDRAIVLALAHAIDLNHVPTDKTKIKSFLLSIDSLAPELDFTDAPHSMSAQSLLSEALRLLKNQLPEVNKDTEKFAEWWQAHGETWTERLRAVMISHRNIGHNWQFTEQQRKVLRQYYDANQLLLDCLNSDCYVTRTVREELKETLFLPTANSEQKF